MTTEATLDRTVPLPELARAWGWSQRKLYRLVEAGAIPHLRIRGRYYFELSAVEAWKAAARREAVEQSSPARVNSLADLIDPEFANFGR